jgi:hypothetical protein
VLSVSCALRLAASLALRDIPGWGTTGWDGTVPPVGAGFELALLPVLSVSMLDAGSGSLPDSLLDSLAKE